MSHDLKPDDVADWLTPRQALQILAKAFKEQHTSKHVLLERLRGGMVQATAGHASLEGRQKTRGLLFKMPSEHWQRIETSDPLWTTGDVNYRYREYGSGEMVTARLYGIKFEPQAVHAIVEQVSVVAESPVATGRETADEIAPKAPVSEDHLKAWYDLYRRVYTGAADTEAAAITSAAGMFPGKSVARERIRKLRGARPIGRPKKPE
jgi:hypothetical protein